MDMIMRPVSSCGIQIYICQCALCSWVILYDSIVSILGVVMVRRLDAAAVMTNCKIVFNFYYSWKSFSDDAPLLKKKKKTVCLEDLNQDFDDFICIWCFKRFVITGDVQGVSEK